MCGLMISEIFLLIVVEKAERSAEKAHYHLIMLSAFSAYRLWESYRVLQFPMLSQKLGKPNVFSETQGMLLAVSILKSNKKLCTSSILLQRASILILEWRNGI